MIDKSLLQAILSAYQLKEPEGIELIHNGTNRVYRMTFAPDSAHPQIAIKLIHTNSVHDVESKHAEAAILNRLRSRFPQLPQTLEPADEAPQTIRHSWGLQWQREYLISVYSWLPHVPYRGLEQQLKQAGKCLVQLQQALATIDVAELRNCNKQTMHQRLRIQGTRLILDENFHLSRFRDYIVRHASNSKPCSLLNNHFRCLEKEFEELHSIEFGSNPLLDAQRLSLVHLELSPSNFGFNIDHTVAVVFDFDSISYGHPLQDTAWLAATFCVDDRKAVTQVAKDLRVLFKAMQPHLNTYNSWQNIILPFMRLGYLDAIFRKLQRAYEGLDIRMGFVREDILCLNWLRRHNDQLISEIAQI